jgi:hypothetical protein
MHRPPQQLVQENCNTISIECIMKSQTDTQSAAGMDNAARLIASIFKQHNRTVAKNFYTHNYRANYKETPMSSDGSPT